MSAIEKLIRELDSVLELPRAADFLRSDERWVLGAHEALVQLAQAKQLVDRHKDFLRRHGLLPEYLTA